MREKFTASVQYNDFKGTVAADVHDSKPLSEWLKEQGLIREGEHIVGISIYSGEIHNKPLEQMTLGLNAYVRTSDVSHEDFVEALNNQPDDSLLRKVEVQMSPAQFFALFKRFEITMSRKNIMDGVQLAYHEDPEESED